jgi:hypothetical protein
MTHALINVPAKAKRGEVIEIKTMISHPMETGYRRDEVGKAIPRDIIHRFTCTYNGVEVFRASGAEEIASPARPRSSPHRSRHRSRPLRTKPSPRAEVQSGLEHTAQRGGRGRMGARRPALELL